MQFKKFLAADMPSALAAVKAAMGPDAVIVAIRERPRQGFWRRAAVEVTASFADNRPQASTLSVHAGIRGEAFGAMQAPAQTQLTALAQAPSGRSPEAQMATADAQRSSATPRPGAGGAYAQAQERADVFAQAPEQAELCEPRAPRRALLVELEEELAQAREALRQKDERLAELTAEAEKIAAKGLRQRPGYAQSASAPAAANDASVRQQVQAEFSDLKRMLTGITLGAASLGKAAQHADRSILEAADVDPEVAEDLVRDLEREGCEPGAHGASVERLKSAIAFAMPTVGDFFSVRKPRRIALVGPTGVGKTTTVAKIAAHAALKHDLRVALIGLDTYRIGASEQLGHYARLIGVPVKTAYDRTSFTDALQAFQNYDLVLIDTAGRGPNQAGAHCLQLRQLFADHDVELYLTLAAATRRLERAEMLDAMGDLSPLNARALVLTKLDEAVALGSALSLTHATGLPLAFVTSGQRVPEDLTAADAASLAEHMVERVLHSRTQSAKVSARPRRGRATSAQPNRSAAHVRAATALSQGVYP